MPDDVDQSILAMQHLEAQARAQLEERAAQAAADSLKTRAQKLAWEAQQEIDAAEKQLAEAEAKQAEARAAGKPPLEAADLLTEGKSAARDAQARLVKARARLNFALDQMDEAERKAWDALRASARADAHGQLVEEP
jgi:exonuclease VII small subunit